jgi:hypothetical protein
MPTFGEVMMALLAPVKPPPRGRREDSRRS